MAARVCRLAFRAQQGINTLLTKRGMTSLNVLTLVSMTDIHNHLSPEDEHAFSTWTAELSFLINQQSSHIWSEGEEAQFLSQRKIRAQKASLQRSATMRRHFFTLLDPSSSYLLSLRFVSPACGPQVMRMVPVLKSDLVAHAADILADLEALSAAWTADVEKLRGRLPFHVCVPSLMTCASSVDADSPVVIACAWTRSYVYETLETMVSLCCGFDRQSVVSWWLVQALVGLCTYHSAGIHHGHIKPSNVGISSSNHVWILDPSRCYRPRERWFLSPHETAVSSTVGLLNDPCFALRSDGSSPPFSDDLCSLGLSFLPLVCPGVEASLTFGSLLTGADESDRGAKLWGRLAPSMPSSECCLPTLLQALVTAVDRPSNACAVILDMLKPAGLCCDFQRVWRGYIDCYVACIGILSSPRISSPQQRLTWILLHGRAVIRLLASSAEGLDLEVYQPGNLPASPDVLDERGLSRISELLIQGVTSASQPSSLDEIIAAATQSLPTLRRSASPSSAAASFVSCSVLPLLQWLTADILTCDKIDLKLTALSCLDSWSTHCPPRLLLLHVVPVLLTSLSDLHELRLRVATTQTVINALSRSASTLDAALVDLVFLHLLPLLLTRMPPPLWGRAMALVVRLQDGTRAFPGAFDAHQHFMTEVMRPTVDAWWAVVRSKSRPAFLQLTPWLVRLLDSKDVKRTLTPMWLLILNDRDVLVRQAMSKYLWFRFDSGGETSCGMLDTVLDTLLGATEDSLLVSTLEAVLDVARRQRRLSYSGGGFGCLKTRLPPLLCHPNVRIRALGGQVLRQLRSLAPLVFVHCVRFFHEVQDSPCPRQYWMESLRSGRLHHSLWSPEIRSAILSCISGRPPPANPGTDLVPRFTASQEEANEIDALKATSPFVLLPTLSPSTSTVVLPVGCEYSAEYYTGRSRWFRGDVVREVASTPVHGSHAAWRDLQAGPVVVEALSPAKSSLFLTANSQALSLWTAEEVLQSVAPRPTRSWVASGPATALKRLSNAGEVGLVSGGKLAVYHAEAGLLGTMTVAEDAVAVEPVQDNHSQLLFVLSSRGRVELTDSRIQSAVVSTFECPSMWGRHTCLTRLGSKNDAAYAVVAASADGVLSTIDVRVQHLLASVQLQFEGNPVPIHCADSVDAVSWKHSGRTGQIPTLVVGCSGFGIDSPLVWLDPLEQFTFNVMGSSRVDLESLPMPTLSTSLTPCKGFTSSDRCSALVTLEDFHIACASSGFCQLWNLTQRRFRFWDLSGNNKGGSLKRFAYGQAFIHPQIHPSADSVSSLCALQLPSKEDLSSCLVAGVNEGVYVVW